MAALNLAAGAPPVFLSENYLNRFAYDAGDLVATDGGSLVQRLYDMVPESIFSTLESVDEEEESIVGGLWIDGVQADRDIDFVALMNHNLKDYHIGLSADNGASYATDQAYTNDAAINRIISMASVVGRNKFRIRATSVQDDGESPPNAQKQIGNIIVAKALLQTSIGFADYDPDTDLGNVISARMANGSKRWCFMERADVGHKFYTAKVVFLGMPKGEHDIIKSLADEVTPFLWMPEPGERPEQIFLSRIVPESFKGKYLGAPYSMGYRVEFGVEEVGGG